MSRPAHTYKPTTEAFPDLDINKVAKELDLEARAKARADDAKAIAPDAGLDDIETEIVEYADADRKQRYQILEDALQSYAHRIASLDFHGRVTAIHQTVPDCVTALQAELASGADALHRLRRALVEHETELSDFRTRHQLKRPARTHSSARSFLKWGFLFLLLVVECVLNGSFLAKGSALGWVGGITEALAFAALNVGAAFAAATLGARLLIHRFYSLKLIGAVTLLTWVVLVVVLNLSLAHYREVAGTLASDGGREVLNRLREAPLHLAELQSWVLFGIGVLFAIAAFVDSFMLFDPYWGYGGIDRRVQKASDAYRQRKAWLVDELHNIYSEYSDQIRSLGSDLSARLSEYDRILAGRRRMLELFDAYQNQLENAVRALLRKYRSARNIPTDAAYRFTRLTIQPDEPASQQRADVEREVSKGHDVLRGQADILHHEFRAGLQKYDQIDDLVGDWRPRNGA